MRKEMVVRLSLAAILLGGCISPWGMNLQSDQKRQLEESRATEAVAE